MRETFGGSGTGELRAVSESSLISVGNTVSRDDLLYLCGLSGKGLPVRVIDYAAVKGLTYGTAQTDAATGRIVAQTVIDTQAVAPGSRQAVSQLADGSILTLSSYLSGIGGAKLAQFAADGSVLKAINVDSTVTEAGQHKLLKLSNGNIAAVFCMHGSPWNIKIAVYDANLNEIKALTVIASVPTNSPYYDAVALSGGGFAVIYQDEASPLLSKLATFDNSGTAVLAATTVWTRTGTTGAQYHAMAQLSNGNLAFAISSVNTASSIGLYYSIWTAAGVQVLAATNLGTVSLAAFPEIVAGIGYFAVARANGTDQKAWIFDNAGTIQGSGFSSATTAGNASNKIKILWGGVDFYLIWHRSSDSKCVLTNLPVTGTGYISTNITIAVTQYNFYLDAFFLDGFILAISMSNLSADAPKMWVIDTASGSLVNAAGTTFGTAPTTVGGKMPAVISGGDRAFIAMYDYENTPTVNLCVGKWAHTAVLGVSADSVTKNIIVAVQNKPGTYKINPVGGARNKAFDMSSGIILGGKGVMVSGGSVTFV